MGLAAVVGVGSASAQDGGVGLDVGLAPPAATPDADAVLDAGSDAEAALSTFPDGGGDDGAAIEVGADAAAEVLPVAEPTPPPGAAAGPSEPDDRAPGEPTIVPITVPTVDPTVFDNLFPVLPEGGPWTTVGLLVLLLAAILVASALRRARDGLPDTGVVPRIVDVSLTAVRVGMVLIAIGLLARLIPASLGPALSWALLAAAAAVGWTARDVLPDILAALVLFFERRIRPGVWVTAAGHSGIVEARGLRAVWVRDGLGHRIGLPNRLFLTEAVVSQTGGAFHDVSLRFAASRVPAARVRRALHDAVLTSPWVQPDAAVIIRRDGTDPTVWHVRARLLDVAFAVSFEGDLLERAEEMLEGAAPRRGDEGSD